LRGQQKSLLNTLREQEIAINSDVTATSEKEIQTLSTKGLELIDHLFMRVLELMLLTVVLFSLVVWILLRRFSAKPQSRAERIFHRAA
jgi:hypothetical protein